MRSHVVIVSLALLAGCSGAVDCASTAPCGIVAAASTSLEGTWTETQAWRDLGIQMTLDAVNGVVRGSGAYTSTTRVTAGTLDVHGLITWQDAMNAPSGSVIPAHASIALDLTFDDGTKARFDQGVLVGNDTLRGVLTFAADSSTSYGTTFVRGMPLR